MRKILFIPLILIAGCSSQPNQPTPPKKSVPKASAPLPKAAPARGTEAPAVYRHTAEPAAIKDAPVNPMTVEVKEGLSCDTPLGMIPDGGKATGFLQDVVGPNDVCISDIITCKDGVWSGQAIHPACKAEKPK